jgi:glutathione S-transferase
MLTIYHAPGTRSIRVIWLCEELGVPYERVVVDFSPAYRASAEWRKLNPVGKVPALRDGDFTMFESGAMVEYILERYGHGRLRPPPGTRAAAMYFQWSWFAEATFARPLGDIAQHTFVKPEAERVRAVVEDGRVRAFACLEALDAAVPDGAYLVDGTFTAADIMMGYTLILARRFEVLTSANYANVNAYMARLETHAGFIKAQS